MIVRNWRDVRPTVDHDGAIVWHVFAKEGSPWERAPEAAYLNCMKRMSFIVKHALQGRKAADLHSHHNHEQLYYILKGKGTVLVGDERQEVKEGDTVYLPSDIPHQIANRNEDWLEYLVIGCDLD